MKSFGELGRAAISDSALDAKTKELIALALGVAARCDPCIGFHMRTLVKLDTTRQESDETLGVTTYMGGGPSLMHAANAIATFDEFTRAAAASTAKGLRSSPPARARRRLVGVIVKASAVVGGT